MADSGPPLRILLIGSGGREHALAWKLLQSQRVEHIFVAPGNGGTQSTSRSTNVDIKATEYEKLKDFAVDNNVNLVIPGPDQAVVDGIEAVFRRVGIHCFCPSPAAAQMEGSKSFAKAFMKRHGIPTAAYERFTSADEATKYVKSVKHRIVIKADGLAAGKGVLLPQSTEEAIQGIQEIMVQRSFGSAGDEIIIEEYLDGQELSVLVFSDGYTFTALPPAQDHKRIGDGDTGLNTGGMGTYSPTPIASPQLNKAIHDLVLAPTFKGFRKDGYPFLGMLFVGLMIGHDGQPKVLEYNVRFGDPETQSVLALMSPSCDLAEILLACCERRLDCIQLQMQDAVAVTVVLASAKYPVSSTSGVEITLKPLPENCTLFHAGTAQKGNTLVTAGGRVFGVTAVAPSLEQAVKLAYEGVACVSFDGMQYRKDIAYRALSPSKTSSINGNMTYASAGVDIEAGNELVNQIKSVVKATKRSGADSDIGGFGGAFDLKAAGYEDPILVSGTDGVGTKLKIAQEIGKHDTIGIDLVAMSVNDLIVQGAEPLFFLDYFACSKLNVQTAASVVKGVAAGCKACNCALIGGETAEMPGLYQGEEYDLAGFAVGAVNRDGLLPLTNITSDDVLIGMSSSGLHSNGFSLVRKIVAASGLSFNSPCPWQADVTLGEALLEPTLLYITQLLRVLRDPNLKGAIKGLANITGGGWIDNIPRMLPKDLDTVIDASQYKLPPVFRWLMEQGNVEAFEMTRAFNCGTGMVLAVEASREQEIIAAISAAGEASAYHFGHLEKGKGVVRVEGLSAW